MAKKEYIELESAKKVLEEHYAFNSAELLDEVPKADVQEVRHGKWERYDETNALYCSYCGKPATNKKEMSWHSYCPICGCKMDKE